MKRQAAYRERENQRDDVIRYYKEQRDTDVATNFMAKDDAKRNERKMLERKQQQEMIGGMEQV